VIISQAVMKCAYFMAVIDGVFCVGRACDEQTRRVSVVALEWVEVVSYER